MRVILQKPPFIQKHDVRAKTMNRMNDTTFFPKREDESTIQEQELTACARERLPKKNPWRHSKIWEQNSKRPLGLHDGLSAELYKAFWKDISAILF